MSGSTRTPAQRIVPVALAAMAGFVALVFVGIGTAIFWPVGVVFLVLGGGALAM